MSKFTSKASSLASRFDNEDEIVEEAISIQTKWDEKANTFSKNTQIDSNTVLSEPITSEEYYKSKDW